jgi:hypothetical protein
MNRIEPLSLILSILLVSITFVVGNVSQKFGVWIALMGTGVSLIIIFGIALIMKGYGQNTYERELRNIVEQLKETLPTAKYSWLYSADEIDMIERNVKCKEIWVISPDLSNDTSPAAIKIIEAVKKNLKKQIAYTYIVPDTE